MTNSGGYVPADRKGSGDPEAVTMFFLFSNKRNSAAMSKKLLARMKNPAAFFLLPVRITRHAIKIKDQP